MAYKDYYQILGVNRTADADAIKTAYRKLAKEHHPDRNQNSPKAEAKFKDINEAYTALSDPEKRQIYDSYGAGGRPSPPPGGYEGGGYGPGGGETSNFSEFFRDLFGSGAAGSAANYEDLLRNASGAAGAAPRRTQQRPQDLEATMPIGLREAFVGTNRAVEVSGRRLEVHIPAGARDGQKLRLTGQAPGGGNIMLRIKILEDAIFELDGDDVRSLAEIAAPLAVVGGKARVETLGGHVELSIAAGTQNGRILRLRGQGWPKKDGTRGDQLLELRLAVPNNPSPAELELYRQLAELL
jgi:curved DNA-binding protein